MKRVLLFNLLILALLVPAAAQEVYVLGVGDEISVTVARHPEYNGSFAIPDSGVVNFPLLGEMNLLGKSLAEVERVLTERASARLNHPSVYVTLVKPRPKRVSVIGLVQTPGVFALLPGWRVSEALAAAGGLTAPAEQLAGRLFRTAGEDVGLDLAAILRDGAQDANLSLREGDTIAIVAKKTVRVYVTGAVKNPGMVELDEGMTAVQALARAGGHSETASLSRAFVTRNGSEKLAVDLYAVLVQGQVQQDLILRQDDVLTVPPVASRVAVFGEVASPGWYPLPEEREIRLADALGLAGGLLKSGIASRITLLRADDPKGARRVVNFLRYLKSGDESANPPIHDGDIVVVSANRREDWVALFNTLVTLGLARLIGR